MATNLTAQILGKERAEADREMLRCAFIATPEFRTLVSGTSNYVVVGRRGTGKSALCEKLREHFSEDRHVRLLHVTPTEIHVAALRTELAKFGTTYREMRSASNLAWRVGISLEIISGLKDHYRASDLRLPNEVLSLMRQWNTTGGTDITERMHRLLRPIIQRLPADEHTLASLSHALNTKALKDTALHILQQARQTLMMLFDCLDEGWLPDEPSTGFVGGLVQLASEFDNAGTIIRISLFIRDNIYRAMAVLDPDHDRNIEGMVLRLYWDEATLFTLACARIRHAFHLQEIESDAKLWRRVTQRGLQGTDGFQKCLRLTLYRPRDLLILLNRAFLAAARENRDQLIDSDVENSADHISQNRLSDLKKEYSVVLPGLEQVIDTFRGTTGTYTYTQLATMMDSLATLSDLGRDIQQHQAILQSQGLIQQLYGIGFLGVLDQVTNKYKFCHDGSAVDESAPRTGDTLIAHPCYARALSLQSISEAHDVADIYDEHDIAVISKQTEIRTAQVGNLLAQLGKVQVGDEHAAAFEEWCRRAIEIVCAGSLRSVELHPNKDAIQRRDVVARCVAIGGFWQHLSQHYDTSNVIFEVKNYAPITQSDVRQLVSYLGKQYGRAGFIISRDSSVEIQPPVLGWFLEAFQHNERLCMLLPADILHRSLSKSRQPLKHDEVDDAFFKILDLYERNYLSLRHTSARKRKQK